MSTVRDSLLLQHIYPSFVLVPNIDFHCQVLSGIKMNMCGQVPPLRIEVICWTSSNREQCLPAHATSLLYYFYILYFII